MSDRRAGPRPRRALHLIGLPKDHGGVLSVLRNVVSVSNPAEWEHVVWVNEDYEETREPALRYAHTRMNTANPVSPGEIGKGVRDLLALLRRDDFD